MVNNQHRKALKKTLKYSAIVLFLSAFSCLTEQKTEVSVIMLTLLGFVVYGLLFEARARYTYLFSPFFIILSVLGMQCLDRRKRDV